MNPTLAQLKLSPRKALQPIAFLALGAGVALGGQALYENARPDAAQALLTEPAAQHSSVDAAAGSVRAPANFVAAVVQKAGPAVVRIDATRTVSRDLPDNPMVRRFFGDRLPPESLQRGTGSGFITSADGQILTNAHVVDGAETVTVTLKDGRTLDGRVIGSDPVTDVAVVKVDATNLPTVQPGDSDQLQVGEWAIAIGNPLGLDNTVTTGIISATGRTSSQVGVPDKRVDFIQTDAAINPGNSGGPLLNINGEAIGMTTAIVANAQSLGFAIPIAAAQRIAEQLVATGRVEHPYLGIQMVELSPEVKARFEEETGRSLSAERGVLVVRVMPDSPAARAGFRVGDAIQSLDGQEVSDAATVQALVAAKSVGDRLSVRVQRDGATRSLTVQTSALPTE